MKFDLTINQSQIQKVRQQIINQSAKELQLKGFRKGKAPLDLVEQQLDESKIQQQIINQLVPDLYVDYVTKNNLQPIGQPEITPKSLGKDSDWKLEVEIAQFPDVDLQNYQSKLKKTQLKPAKDTSKMKTEDKDAELVEKIFDTLLDTCQLEVPDLLIKQEVEHKLSHLVKQLDQLNLTLDTYATSINKSAEEIKKEYTQTATDKLKLEFILEAIRSEQKITASQSDIQAYINTVKDPLVQKQLSSDKRSQDTIKFSIERDKVIEYLKTLVQS